MGLIRLSLSVLVMDLPFWSLVRLSAALDRLGFLPETGYAFVLLVVTSFSHGLHPFLKDNELSVISRRCVRHLDF